MTTQETRMTYEESLKAQTSLTKKIRKEMALLDEETRHKIAVWFAAEYPARVQEAPRK